jgi:Transcriptional regulatory protein, C terminal
MGCEAQALDLVPDIAVRLADEGVPVRAIARAVKVPSEILRQRLYEAQATGRLLDLPHDDWPPGFPRDQRALQLSRLVVENKEVVFVAVQRLFGIQRREVPLLLHLIQHDMMSKKRGAMSERTIDVHICRMRKQLRPFAVEILTLWGYGYKLSMSHRRKAMDIILRHVATLPIL